MSNQKVGAFEIVLLIVGVSAAFLGFQLINNVYIIEKSMGWLMIISLFNWLILLVLFVSLSLTVDVSKKQLEQLEKIASLLGKKKGKK